LELKISGRSGKNVRTKKAVQQGHLLGGVMGHQKKVTKTSLNFVGKEKGRGGTSKKSWFKHHLEKKTRLAKRGGGVKQLKTWEKTRGPF